MADTASEPSMCERLNKTSSAAALASSVRGRSFASSANGSSISMKRISIPRKLEISRTSSKYVHRLFEWGISCTVPVDLVRLTRTSSKISAESSESISDSAMD